VVCNRRQAVIQRARAVFCFEVREQIHHAGVYGETLSPPSLPVMHSELETDSEGLGRIHASLEQRDHALGDDQRDVALEPISQPLALMGERIYTRLQVYPHFVAADLNRIDAHIVGPQVEGSAARQVEPRVMPMTGEYAFLDSAPVEGKAHVRTAI